jgi:hypothetical protein
MILVHTHSSSTDRLYYTPSNAAVPKHAVQICTENASLCRTKRQESTRGVVSLQDIHLPHLTLPPRFPLDTSDRVAYPPALGADLLVEGLKSITAINPAAWQYHWIILDNALGMMCVRDVAR